MARPKQSRPKQLGPYEIGDSLGKGGMGQVYAAVHSETGERVAVKVLSAELASSEGFRERFEAEIASLRMLKHPGIVELYGYGQDHNTHFYSMELVEGLSLEEEIRNRRRFSWRDVTNIAVQLCKALKHAHDHGVIHRDIKPANILITPDDRVKLADFGIARMFGGTSMTMAGGVLGTADYMAPEQAEGKPVSGACDQYSLGCVMYALLAGRPPFRADSLPAMLQLQRYADHEPVTRYARRTPKQLSRVIDQLLEKNAEKRFPNTAVLARHLEAMTHALSRVERDDFEIADDDADTDAAPLDGVVAGSIAGSQAADWATQDDPSLADSEDGISLPGVAPSRPAGRHDETLVAPDEDAPPPPPEKRFVAVTSEAAEQSSGIWPLAGGLVAVIALLFACWMMLRPATADELHAKLTAYDPASESFNWRSASETLDQFRSRFPNDARTDEFDAMQQAIDAERLARDLSDAVLRGDAYDSRLAPAEQLYVEAMRNARQAPDEAAAALRRLSLLLAGSSAEASTSSDRQTLRRLVQRQLDRLERRIVEHAQRHRPWLKEQLDRAATISQETPDEAAAIRRAIVDTYEDKPWANDIVEQARTQP